MDSSDDDSDNNDNNDKNDNIKFNTNDNDINNISSKLSPNPKYQLLPISIPYASFRNRERNYFGRSQSPIDKISNSYIRDHSSKQTKYYNETLAESNIPSKFLNDTIEKSLSTKSNEKYHHSTLIGCSHETESLVVHVAGAHMDELILRKASNLVPGDINSLGFTLS